MYYIKKTQFEFEFFLIKECLRGLESIDLQVISYDNVFTLCKYVFNGKITKPLYSLKVINEDGYGIFRAREVFKNVFEDEEDFWHRQANGDDSDQFGRCHEKGKSMLYCSNHFSTCFLELNLKKHKKYILTEYEFISPIVLKKINYLSLGMKLDREIVMEIPPFDPVFSWISVCLENYIFNCFVERVGKKNIYHYKKTAAITNIFSTSDQMIQTNHGIIYPSVKTKVKTNNLAYKPEVAKQILRIKKSYLISGINFNYSSGKINFKVHQEGHLENRKMVWVPANKVEF